MSASLDFQDDLAIVDFGDDERIDSAGELADPRLWERPHHDETQRSDPDAFVTCETDGFTRDSRGDAVAHDDDFGAIDALFLVSNDAIGVLLDLVDESMHARLLTRGAHHRIPA